MRRGVGDGPRRHGVLRRTIQHLCSVCRSMAQRAAALRCDGGNATDLLV